MDVARQSDPESANRCALEDEYDGGCCFKCDDEDRVSTEDSPEGTNRKNAVLEQNACWHGIKSDQLLGWLESNLSADAHTENFTNDMLAEYSTSKA